MERRTIGAAVLAMLMILVLASSVDGASEVNRHGDSQPSPDLPGRTSVHKTYTRSLHAYAIPDVALIDQHGKTVPLRSELNDTPVLLNFIFTSCPSICPVLSATFSQVQRELEPDSPGTHLVSISIDPAYDTPERLNDYARRFRGGPGWHFLTGRADDIMAVQQAFGAYRGDKMNHATVTFLRASPQAPWVRLEGFTSTADLISEYRQMPLE